MSLKRKARLKTRELCPPDAVQMLLFPSRSFLTQASFVARKATRVSPWPGKLVLSFQPISRTFSQSRMSFNKKIIVCCDGTWQDSDDSDAAPTNSKSFQARAIVNHGTYPRTPFDKTAYGLFHARLHLTIGKSPRLHAVSRTRANLSRMEAKFPKSVTIRVVLRPRIQVLLDRILMA